MQPVPSSLNTNLIKSIEFSNQSDDTVNVTKDQLIEEVLSEYLSYPIRSFHIKEPKVEIKLNPDLSNFLTNNNNYNFNNLLDSLKDETRSKLSISSNRKYLIIFDFLTLEELSELENFFNDTDYSLEWKNLIYSGFKRIRKQLYELYSSCLQVFNTYKPPTTEISLSPNLQVKGYITIPKYYVNPMPIEVTPVVTFEATKLVDVFDPVFLFDRSNPLLRQTVAIRKKLYGATFNWDFDRNDPHIIYFDSLPAGTKSISVLFLHDFPDVDNFLIPSHVQFFLRRLLGAKFLMFEGQFLKRISSSGRGMENDGSDLYQSGKDLYDTTLNQLIDSAFTYSVRIH